jgi:hypothetical protein
MKTLQWVNDPDVALHIHHSRGSGTAEVGFRDGIEATQSLLTIMDNDIQVAAMVLSATLYFLNNNSSVRQIFLDSIKRC